MGALCNVENIITSLLGECQFGVRNRWRELVQSLGQAALLVFTSVFKGTVA